MQPLYDGLLSGGLYAGWGDVVDVRCRCAGVRGVGWGGVGRFAFATGIPWCNGKKKRDDLREGKEGDGLK